MRYLIFSLLILCSTSPCLAWDGEDAESGGSVTIEKGNLVRSGRDIEVYDQEAGEYRTMEVQDIDETYSGVEVEVYDYDSGEYRTLEMED